MRIMVTGAKGMLGQDLVPILRDQGHDVIPLGRQELDITDRKAVFEAIEHFHPQIVINCAAYTNVDQAEVERDLAYAINALGVQNLALACEDKKCELVQISTDYVFDGTKKTPYRPLDPPNPINWYGYTKLAGEKFVEWHCSRFYIVRTSWLYGKYGKNFVTTILKLAREKECLEVVDDQIGSPTHTKSLSRAIADLIQTGWYGIHHYTDDAGNGISWYEFAQAILQLAEISKKVEPIKTLQLSRPAPRPSYSTLFLTMPAPLWQEELAKFMKA
ncbi:MAG: dTDP-4-dehydrorhamnose reductase [Caldiserica bacterium]|nr:dTDP-4-dehydrorhamnose reductase [Caldisericota bacterium]